MRRSTVWFISVAVILAVTASKRANADDIFVVNYGPGGAGWVGEYTAAGATVNANLISGFNGPIGIAASGTNLFVTNAFSNGMNPLMQDVVGEYTTAGQVVNASLITGLNEPISIAASGGNLYVGSVNAGGGLVGEYTTSGAVVNPSLVVTDGATTYGEPYGLAISGNDLFVSKPYYSNTVGKYDATTGATVNAAFLAGLNIPYGLAVYDGHLLVGNLNDGTVGEYDANTGALINPTFIQMSANGPYGMTIHDGNLFVTNYGAGTIGEYDATTGATINANLVTGLTDPTGIVFAPAAAPLPSALEAGFLLLAVLGAFNALRVYYRRRRSTVEQAGVAFLATTAVRIQSTSRARTDSHKLAQRYRRGCESVRPF